MRATFYGFETMRKALNASQKGLDVTGQNIANANTVGYTRQRVELSAVAPNGGITQYAPIRMENVGQGVEVLSISQVRDQFLDLRYRAESSQAGQYDTLVSAMSQVEDILDETTTDGLNDRLGDYYKKLSEYSKNPESVEFASILRSSARQLTAILNQYSSSFTTIQHEQQAELKSSVADLNNMADKLANINNQIKAEQIQGSVSNELYDTRNMLLDQMSKFTNLTYETGTDGATAVKLGDRYLVDPSNTVSHLTVDDSGSETDIQWEDGQSLDTSSGSLRAYLDILNGKGSLAETGENSFRGLKYYMQSLDSLAQSFADTMNDINGVGSPLFSGDESGTITAANISISDGWTANAEYVTNSTTSTNAGANDNILRMMNAMQQDATITPGFSGTFEEFTTSLSSDIAVDKDYYNGMQSSANSVLDSIGTQRESVMGVSLDEEATNMLMYQKAYNAAARMMTILDEMLDTLINRTGVSGR